MHGDLKGGVREYYNATRAVVKVINKALTMMPEYTRMSSGTNINVAECQ